MRRLIALALVLGFSLALPIGPAFADDQSIGQTPAQFRALAGMAAPVPMTDEQLAAVEGEGFCVLSACVNAAVITQTNAAANQNTSVLSKVRQSNRQSNWASVRQSIN
jgi:hypothetical protein